MTELALKLRRGDNTDGVGLVRDLVDNLGVRLEAQRILVLGAGGAARGILGPLLGESPQALHIANRTGDKAVALSGEFSAAGALSGGGLRDIPEPGYDVIINATAASLGQPLPPLPNEVLRDSGAVYDLVYSDAGTAFLEWGRQAGAGVAADGLGMLVEQAAESFFLWTGERPQTRPVLELLRP